MFAFIKEKFQKIYTNITRNISPLFSHGKPDEAFLKALSEQLIAADAGTKSTHHIIDLLKKKLAKNNVPTLEQARLMLEKILIDQLTISSNTQPLPPILLMLGVNGTGKTTFVAKLANLIKQSGGRPLLVAGDTFRAAATNQLAEWATKIDVPIFIGKENQDPSSVIFDACSMFKQGNYTHLIVDTAGRLQTKTNLMRELEKMKRILDRQLTGQQVHAWLSIDAMMGQNSLIQAQVFHEATQVNGIILTKLDGTGKGGIIFAITHQLQIPIVYITFGETLDAIKQFDAQEFVKGLLYE